MLKLNYSETIARYYFSKGKDKRPIEFKTIGTNLILKTNKMLDIKLKPAYEILSNQENWGEKYKDWQEPQKYTEIMAKNSDLRPANPVWLPRVDFLHFIQDKLTLFHNIRAFGGINF